MFNRIKEIANKPVELKVGQLASIAAWGVSMYAIEKYFNKRIVDAACELIESQDNYILWLKQFINADLKQDITDNLSK